METQCGDTLCPGVGDDSGGRQYGGGAWKWVESMRDYDDKRYVAAKLLWGVKKDVFNSTDRGCIVISTYAKAHA